MSEREQRVYNCWKGWEILLGVCVILTSRQTMPQTNKRTRPSQYTLTFMIMLFRCTLLLQFCSGYMNRFMGNEQVQGSYKRGYFGELLHSLI